MLGAAILCSPDAALAQDAKPPQLIQDAFVSDLAFVQGRGEIQIGSLARIAGAGATRTAGIPLGIEYGITDQLQVSVETGGFTYQSPSAWSSPRDFGLALKYGRYGLLPNLHAAVTLGAESERGSGARTTSATSALLLGVDLPRLRMTHLFTSVAGSLWKSEGTRSGVDWFAGAIVPFRQLRATIERPLRVADPSDRGTVPGLVWKIADGLEIGAATTLRTRPATRLSGAMLSLIVEF